jgi:hypothetical protein
MSRPPCRTAGSIDVEPQPPMPPVGGWRLMQAAEILCPREARLYREGGAALEAAMEDELLRLGTRATRMPELRRHLWLTLKLLTALSCRPGLQLTGRPYQSDPLVPRHSVQPDVLRAACRQDDGAPTDIGYWARFDFQHDHARIGFDYPRDHIDRTKASDLVDVRIESTASGASAMPIHSDVTSVGKGALTRPEFTEASCRAWFKLRVGTWPKDAPPPTTEECLAAARLHFAGTVSRDKFRAIRRATVPASWKKPGPRRPRS